MISSMTGYARLERDGEKGRVIWELRSVNHRYLDLGFKLPEEFRVMEPELRQQAMSALSRGKVEISLRYQRELPRDADIVVDESRLRALRLAVDRVAEALGPLAAPDPLRVLAFPGVLHSEPSDFSGLVDLALESFAEVLKLFVESRRREGATLGQHLLSRCEAIEGLAQTVLARLPSVRDQWLERLKARCLELGVDVEPQRLAQEVVLAATRLDVDEELSRLAAHLKEVRKTLARDEPVGRRLDFLMQELNREVNTLSSKSQDAQITRCAVDMKVLIEQMREQVQNIE